MALVHIRAAVQQMSATLHDAMAPGTMAWLEQVMAPAMVDYHPDPG